ncbi:hypothetical protein ACFQWH_17305 [Mycolicibacterium sp. GCM10028919]|uniref:hypothetical protein n=1 Tax=Mycolicibacterium sp. GCM10028919 TaxID=3273401 RepID=UPI00361F1E68
MPPSDHWYRSTVLDRALAPSRTVATVGPVAGLDVDRARAVLAAAEAHPRARLALQPSPADQRWASAVGVSERVRRRDDMPTADLGALLTAVRHEPGTKLPVDAFLAGDHVVVDYSHGIGDGQLGVALLSALSGEFDEARSGALAQGLPPGATRRAAARHFRAHPGAMRDIARLRAENKPDADDRPKRSIEGWQEHNRSATAYLPPATVADVRSWVKTNAPGATTASVTVALWRSALRAAGAQIDDRFMVLMNCRRYLAPEFQQSQGNFAVAMPMRLPWSASPAEIAALVRRVYDSGWPLVVLLMAQAKSLIGRGETGVPPTTYDASGRIRLSVSDLGRLSALDHVSWVPGERPPQLAAYLEPDGPDAVTLLISELAGGRTFTATFCSAVVEPDLVDAALTRMCSDPLGTLLAAKH